MSHIRDGQGRVARSALLAVALASMCAIAVAAQPELDHTGTTWVPLADEGSEPSPPSVEFPTADVGSVRLVARFPGFQSEPVHWDNVTYDKLSMPSLPTLAIAGRPEIPVLRAMIAVPDCYEYRLDIITSDPITVGGARVAPAPRPTVKRDGAIEYVSDVFTLDEGFYTQRVDYPHTRGVVKSDGWIRGQRYLVLELHPIICNPGDSSLSCVGQITIDVILEEPRTTNFAGLGPLEPAARSVIRNYDGRGHLPSQHSRTTCPNTTWAWCSTVAECENLGTDYLMIIEDGLADTMPASPAEFSPVWLARKRASFDCLNVALVKTSDIADPIGPEAIKAFIDSLYHTASAENVVDDHLGYVLLVGDANEAECDTCQSDELLPAYEYCATDSCANGQTTDHWYACVEGDDWAADLLLGRLAVGDTTEMGTEIRKILGYEPAPVSGAWRDSIFLSCGFTPQDNDYAGKSAAATEQMEFIESFVPSSFEIRSFYASTYANGMNRNAQAVNSGKLVIQHFGHGWPCGSLTFNSAQVDTLSNEGELPFFLNVSCGTGNFANTVVDDCGPDTTCTGAPSSVNYDCLGEHLMHWDCSGESGAIAYFGATEPTGDFTTPPYVLHGLFGNACPMLGQATAYGKLRTLEDAGGYAPAVVQYNLLGDPALNLFLTDSSGYAGAPDLVVRQHDASITPACPTYDQDLEFTCRVTNESNCATHQDTAVVVGLDIFRAGGTASASFRDTIGQMPEWGADTIAFTWSVTSDSIGTYYCWFSADPDDSITEIVETNNETADSIRFYISFCASGFPVSLDNPGVSPVTVYDLDGDAEGEIVFQDGEMGVHAYTSSGGVFWEYTPDWWTAPARCPAVADMDLDGLPEIVAVRSLGKIEVGGERADDDPGIFTLHAEASPPGNRAWRKIFATGKISSAPMVADINPVNGRPEVAIIDSMRQGRGRVSVWNFDSATPTMQWAEYLSSGVDTCDLTVAPPIVVNFGLHPADLVMWKLSENPAEIMCVTADDSVRWTREISAPAGGYAYPGCSVAAADLDCDGDLELVAALRDTPPKLVVIDSVTSTICWSSTEIGSNGQIAVGNLDADTELEIVVAGGSRVSVFDYDGNMEWNCTLDGTAVGEPILGDFDGGSDVEIIVGATSEENGDLLYILKIPAMGDTLLELVEPILLPGEYATGAICDLDPSESGNNIVFGTADGSLHCLEYWGTSTSRFEWPMYRHDPRNSGVYQQPVSGTALSSTTWAGNVLLRGDTTFSDGDTLWILPGTTVLVADKEDCEGAGRDTALCELSIHGRLECTGGEVDSITFVSDASSPSSGDWYGLAMESGSSGELAYTRISSAHTSLYAVDIGTDSLHIHNACFRNQAEIGVRLQGCGSGRVNLADCEISDADIGVRVDSSEVRVERNEITNAAEYGIWVSNDKSSILRENTITTAAVTASASPCGIYANASTFDIKIRGNTITIPDSTGTGIYVRSVRNADARVDSNCLSGPGGPPISRGIHLVKTTAGVYSNDIESFYYAFEVSAKRANIPELGRVGVQDGLNSVDTLAYYNIKADGFLPKHDLYAQHNYWGDTSAARFQSSGITIVWQPCLKGRADQTGEEAGAYRFYVEQNSPNPFNPVTTIFFGLAVEDHVELRIYDVAGRNVCTLVDGKKPAGNYSVRWDGTDDRGRKVSSGVYFCRLESGSFREGRKLVLLK